ncbi:MAG: prepilin-type N-terminal cleavage/methylation domain-containing protein, partial [bacterium]
MITFTNNNKKEKGLSLLELIIAVVISSIIVLLTVTLFLSQQKAYIRDEAIAYIQENGHQALELLTTRLRLTGYMLPASFRRLEAYNASATAPDSVAVWGNFSNFITRFWYPASSGSNWVIVYYQPSFKFSSMMWLWIRHRNGLYEEVHRCVNYLIFTFLNKRLITIWFPENDLLQRNYPADSTYILVSTFTREMYKITTQ